MSCFIPKKIIVCIIINCYWCLFQQTDAKRYSNYVLFRTIPKTEEHLIYLRSLGRNYSINFWRPPGSPNFTVEFSAHPGDVKALLGNATARGLVLKPLLNDIQSAFDNQTVKKYLRRNQETYDWSSYFRLDDIYSWMHDMAFMFPSEYTVESIGKSHEDRDIKAVRIKLNGGPLERSVVIIEGGIHAREWISCSFTTYLINRILKAKQSDNEDWRKIALSYEWYLVPVLNPDGYEFSHTKDRLWRKNRRPPDGVDLNRNFDANWGGIGSTKTDKSDETYCGSEPFSEPETIAMKKLVERKRKNLAYYLAFHSYGQFLIIPYAFMYKYVDNFDSVKQVSEKAVRKISVKHGTKYKVGNAYDTVGYLASGGSSCWVKKTFRVPCALTFELRDEGQYGFALPAHKIEETCEEIMPGLIVLLEAETALRTSRDKSQPYDPANVIIDNGNNNIIKMDNNLLFSMFLLVGYGTFCTLF